MTVGLQRATVFAIVQDSGDYVAPYTGAQFVPLRPGNTLNFTAESLDSDELLNDIGAAKSFTGKESSEGSHSAYLRHSGAEGVYPELWVMYESIMGTSYQASEYASVSGSDNNKIVVASGSNFVTGQALLIKNGAGYEIRNVKDIDGNDLNLNFSLNNIPGSGVMLGRAITFAPVASGHPTFSATKYLGNGHAIEATAGNTVTELGITADANGFGELSFSYTGTKYFFNPVIIDSTNKYIDFTDDAGTHSAFIAEKVYKTPVEFADALKAAMESVSPTQAYSVSYIKADGRFLIKSISSAVFSILFSTGDNAANSVKAIMGFTGPGDYTGSLEYYSNDGADLTAPVTPVYDSADAIIIKGAELFIGDQTDNLCVCAQSVSITISKEVQDVDCICEETGVKEKIAVSRSVEMSVTAVLNKYDVSLLDALLKNSGISAMLNAGPKTGGNWVPGKCFNVYLQNCTVSSYTTTGDSFIQAEITLKGYVTSTSKDVYLNFV